MAQATDRLVDQPMIYLLPTLAIAVNLIAAFVIYFARHYELLILKIFSYFTIFIQVLLLTVLLRTILVII